MSEERDIVVVDREEWERFLRDNDELMNRYSEVLQKYKALVERNKILEEKYKEAQGRLRLLEERLNRDVDDYTKILRRIRANISKLLEEAEEKESPISWTRRRFEEEGEAKSSELK